MKVDTKKMTPIAKDAPASWIHRASGCFFNPNKYLPGAESPTKEEEESDEAGGSMIRFIPTLFFTPVKVSARHPPRVGTVDAAGVEEMNQAFAKLLIDGEETKTEEADCPKAVPQVSESEEIAEENDMDAPKLGRYRSAAHSNALRSHRLAEKNRKAE